MLKHVGKHNAKKVVILYREVPGEDHMCLVTYSDALPSLYHNEVMKVLESAAGQQAENLADALFRNIMADGKNSLQELHKGGLIKKVPANQITVTPNSKSSVRLDELNQIIKEMAAGQDAAKKMAVIQDIGKKSNKKDSKTDVVDAAAISGDLLTDADLAKQRIDQANRMKADAERLLQEAQVLIEEASLLDPSLKSNEQTPKKRTSTKNKKD
jgi:hypothetical protein